MGDDVAADLLRRARQASGLTQEALAEKTGISQSVLSAYERGRRQPSVSAAARILAAAGFRIGLGRRLDERRAGDILRQVLDLADKLPKRKRGALKFPRLP